MKELLAQILRQLGMQQSVAPPKEIPQQQPAAPQGGLLTNRQQYLAYVEKCMAEGKPHLPYQQWVQQGGQ